MFTFACKDTGVDCDFVATGETPAEVKEKAFAHAGVVHADLMKSMTEEQLADLARQVDANIKTA